MGWGVDRGMGRAVDRGIGRALDCDTGRAVGCSVFVARVRSRLSENWDLGRDEDRDLGLVDAWGCEEEGALPHGVQAFFDHFPR